MGAAETYGDNPQRVADLPLKVLYILQSPSLPATTRETILSQVDRGERPTERNVQEMVRERRRAAAIEAFEGNFCIEKLLRRAGVKPSSKLSRSNAASKSRWWPPSQVTEEPAQLILRAMRHDVERLVVLINKATAWTFLDALERGFEDRTSWGWAHRNG
jgi:hypothetical protein